MASVNDQDVIFFLKELKEFVFSYGTVQTSGSNNLVEILKDTKLFLKDYLQEIMDNIEFSALKINLYNGYVTSYTNLYIETSLEERLSQHKSFVREIIANSPYMKSLHLVIDFRYEEVYSDVYNSKNFYNSFSLEHTSSTEVKTLIIDYIKDIDTLIEKAENVT